ncbi:GntR family transcriptional regulator [Acetobacterium bakii]|uniref:Transcriptional regulator n=1 Tax=Acetobacterium bakii TaxID=52689 RepID=A0A0L6TWI4_9FIRM|nr:GntR family transcriptional regulator [Acetobacterium bakii]KNZ40636.1 transcriptional regulator [Acetobacterium bakii]
MRKILYLDIVNDIKGKIEKGILKPGDLLPSENELSEQFDVSRTTLRKSLALLVNEKYIYTIPGKGNYVCEPTSNHYQFYFDEIDSLKGQVEEVKLVSVGVITPGRKLMRELKIGSFEKVIKIQKSVWIKNEVVQYSTIFLPYQKGNPIVEDVINFANFQGTMEKGKMQFQLKKILNIDLVHPPLEVRDNLKIDNDESCFLVAQNIISVEDNMPISYNEFYIKKNYFTLTAETTL